MMAMTTSSSTSVNPKIFVSLDIPLASRRNHRLPQRALITLAIPWAMTFAKF
jgi:hypothetical protein